MLKAPEPQYLPVSEVLNRHKKPATRARAALKEASAPVPPAAPPQATVAPAKRVRKSRAKSATRETLPRKAPVHPPFDPASRPLISPDLIDMDRLYWAVDDQIRASGITWKGLALMLKVPPPAFSPFRLRRPNPEAKHVLILALWAQLDLKTLIRETPSERS